MEDVINLRMPTTTRRVPTEGYRDQHTRQQVQQTINQMGGTPTKRASRNRTDTTSRGNQACQQRSGQPRHVPNTYDDGAIRQEPITQPGRGIRPNRRQLPPSVVFFTGMVILLVVWYFGTRVYAWYMNTFDDPIHYTQTSHLDTATLTDGQGQKIQVRAFIDSRNRVNLLIVPEGDPSKSRIIGGAPLVGIDDPRSAMLTVTVSGTNITVLAQGPVLTNWFTAYRQGAQWTIDISKPPAGGG